MSESDVCRSQIVTSNIYPPPPPHRRSKNIYNGSRPINNIARGIQMKKKELTKTFMTFFVNNLLVSIFFSRLSEHCKSYIKSAPAWLCQEHTAVNRADISPRLTIDQLGLVRARLCHFPFKKLSQLTSIQRYLNDVPTSTTLVHHWGNVWSIVLARLYVLGCHCDYISDFFSLCQPLQRWNISVKTMETKE